MRNNNKRKERDDSNNKIIELSKNEVQLKGVIMQNEYKIKDLQRQLAKEESKLQEL